jgi:formate-dependent nitrite reductase cytochrome c552 subunit
MGFHAPQKTARVLAEAIDYARQGQFGARALSTAPVRAH